MTCKLSCLFVSLLCQLIHGAEFVPFVVKTVTSPQGPGRINECCTSTGGIGVFESVELMETVKSQLFERLNMDVGFLVRIVSKSNSSSVETFFRNANYVYVKSVNRDCDQGGAAEEFNNYELPPVNPLVCFGPIDGNYADFQNFRVFKKECDWFQPCEPIEEESLENVKFVPFEFINVTGLNYEEREQECCFERARAGVGFTRAKTSFTSLERRTKVFRQLEKAHGCLNFGIYSDLDTFFDGFQNIAFMTGNGQYYKDKNCVSGRAFQQFYQFGGLTYCVSEDLGRYTKVDSEEKMLQLFGTPTSCTTTSESTSTKVESSTLPAATNADFVPFAVLVDKIGPGARKNKCCDYSLTNGVFAKSDDMRAVVGQLETRFDSKFGYFTRYQNSKVISTRFVGETKSSTISSIERECDIGDASEAFINYEMPQGFPLVCIGLPDFNNHLAAGVVNRFRKECDWNPPCEPLDEAVMTTDEFVPFELLDVTDYKPSLRLDMCCKDREKFGLTRAKAVFSNVEEMTKVFRQLQKVHTVNFAIHTDVESNLNAFLNVVFMTGDGEKVESSDCFVGAAAEKLSNFVGPTYCVSQGGTNRHFDFDTKEKMYDKFGWPPTTTEISTTETSTLTTETSSSTTETSSSTTDTSSLTTETSSPTSTITTPTGDKKLPSKDLPLVDKFCSSAACTSNPPSKCCSFCRPKN